MIRVLSLVEGPTERNFGQRVVASHLANFGVEYRPRVIGKPGHKGGVGHWDRAKKEIIGLLKQEPQSVVTTMFDLYGLPNSWPGRVEARDEGLKYRDAALSIEKKISAAIHAEFLGTSLRIQFVPYLSLHEYEALLFSEPAKLAGVTQGVGHEEAFKAVVAECGECERINDSPQTAPSKRIGRIAPSYTKTIDGIAAAERIGVAAIRASCPHFHSWLERLENLGKRT